MDLREFIKSSERPILLDGGMGTQLDAAGLKMGGQNNLANPDAVFSVHKAYLASGANLILTNTRTMNRIYIESGDEPVDVREVNLAGARLAREAAGDGHYVLGDIGSTGKILKPYGPLEEGEAFETYLEQASLLVEGGVDGLIIETMFDLKEALCALRACVSISELPVFVSMAFRTTRNGGETIMGNSSSECARAVEEAGGTVVGANCGDIDPFQMAEVVGSMLAATSLPVVAQPNAGIPQVVSGRSVFSMTPDDFAEGIDKCLDAGAKLVGGCCGTTPAHTRLVADRLRER